MKKTISITLGRRIFAIEEDGYMTLDAYLKSLRTHFAKDPSVDELLNDIELSFGEKFTEKLNTVKQVVTLEDVESVIAVVGRVEEIANEDPQESVESTTTKAESTETSKGTKKQLYRNMDDHIIAGVCSGIAAYTGVDPLIIRILAIALLFVNGLGLIVYLVLWIALPVAETSLQKLEMQGKSPNLNEFQELTKEKPTTVSQETALYRALNAPLRAIGVVFEWLKRFFRLFGAVIRIGVGIAMLLFVLLLTTLGTMALVVFATNINSNYITSDLPLTELAHNPFYYVGLGSVYLLALIPLIFLAILGVSLLRRKSQFQWGVSGALIVLWVIAAGGAAAAGSHLGPWVYTQVRTVQEQTLITQERLVGSFDRIVVSDNLAVTIRKGEQYSAIFKGSAEDLALLQATTSNGVLSLTQQSKKKDSRLCFACFDERVTGVITLPTLTAVSGANNSDSIIEGFSTDLLLELKQNSSATMTDLDLNTSSSTQQIVLRADGNAYTRLAGSIHLLDVTLKGNTRLNAGRLESEHIKITTQDNASAEVSPLQSFAVTTTHNSFVRSLNTVTSTSILERQNSQVYIEGRTQRRAYE